MPQQIIARPAIVLNREGEPDCCPRCHGLMVRERGTYTDSDGYFEHWDSYWRCMVCGDLWDPVIEINSHLNKPVRMRGAMRIRKVFTM